MASQTLRFPSKSLKAEGTMTRPPKIVHVVVEEVVHALRELSDREFQETRWLGAFPESFVEACCELFADSGLQRALEKNRTGFPPAVDAALRVLEMQLDLFEDDSDAAVLADPRWPMVRENAAKVLRVITELPNLSELAKAAPTHRSARA
jgi:hypothetical protein